MGRSGEDEWADRLANVLSGDRCPLGFSGDRLGRLTFPGEDDEGAASAGSGSSSSAIASASASDELDEMGGESGRTLEG